MESGNANIYKVRRKSDGQEVELTCTEENLPKFLNDYELIESPAPESEADNAAKSKRGG